MISICVRVGMIMCFKKSVKGCAMRRYATIMISILVLSLSLIGAEAADETERYTLKAVEDGFLRLDTKTGAVSTCRKQDSNIICRAAADDRAALQSEIDRLQADNDKLRAQLTELNKAGASKKRTKPKSELPDDEEIDRIMGFFEKLMKRFFKFAQSMRETLDNDI